jgi:hypothetical protein
VVALGTVRETGAELSANIPVQPRNSTDARRKVVAFLFHDWL